MLLIRDLQLSVPTLARYLERLRDLTNCKDGSLKFALVTIVRSILTLEANIPITSPGRSLHKQQLSVSKLVTCNPRLI